MAIAVYPGSFDPITLGHVDIIRRIQNIFGEVVVLISESTEKSYLFSAEERRKLVLASLKGIPNVKVDVYNGLTVNYVKSIGANLIIRGLRAVTDFEYEFTMANMNRKLRNDIETMIVFASPEYYYIASRTVKEIALHGGPLKDLVPAPVVKALQEKFAKRKKK